MRALILDHGNGHSHGVVTGMDVDVEGSLFCAMGRFRIRKLRPGHCDAVLRGSET